MHALDRSFCPQCGHALSPSTKDVFEQVCPACQTIHYQNPIPVAVALIPIEGEAGFLMGQRNIEPKRGQWALPGGFIAPFESAPMAAARELWEETGLLIPADAFQVFESLVTPPGTQMLEFCRGPAISRAQLAALQAALPADHPETQALGVATRETVLAFPLHHRVAQAELQRA